MSLPLIQKPKVTFISHPYRDNPVENHHKITEICRLIVSTEPDILPLSPLHLFHFMEEGRDRRRIMEFCYWLILLSDEVWVYGRWENSEGCQQEIAWAREIGKPVVFKN